MILLSHSYLQITKQSQFTILLALRSSFVQCLEDQKLPTVFSYIASTIATTMTPTHARHPFLSLLKKLTPVCFLEPHETQTQLPCHNYCKPVFNKSMRLKIKPCKIHKKYQLKSTTFTKFTIHTSNHILKKPSNNCIAVIEIDVLIKLYV